MSMREKIAALRGSPGPELDVVLDFADEQASMLESFRVVPVPIPEHLAIVIDGDPEPDELFIPRSTAERIHAALTAALKEAQR